MPDSVTVSMGPLQFEYAWRTDRGRVRRHNEDAVTVLADLGLAVVADGVGGSRAGEVASQLAVDTIGEFFRAQDLTRTQGAQARLLAESAVVEANRAIRNRAQAEANLVGMGTTVVLGVAGIGWLAYANVGDSRLYRLRNRVLEQLSTDHSYIQQVVDQGLFRSRSEARLSGIGENILTRSLGSTPDVLVATGLTDLQPGDLLLFCSDGLTGMVPLDWLRQILVATGSTGLGPAADALVHLANERGGSDNITLALLRVGNGLMKGLASAPG